MTGVQTCALPIFHSYELAARGQLGAPYVVIYEGSIADERIAASTGGYFSAMGAEKLGNDSNGDERVRPIPTAEWLKRMARPGDGPRELVRSIFNGKYTAAHQDCGKWQVRFCSLSHLVPRPPKAGGLKAISRW